MSKFMKWGAVWAVSLLGLTVGCAEGSTLESTFGGGGNPSSTTTMSETAKGGGGAGGGATGSGGDSSCSMVGETQECYGGEAALAGIGACVMGTQTCESKGEFLSWGPCSGWGEPSEDVCDGADNDCSGLADEGCCVPALEVCDGADNNCDGVVDEGCCVPSPEVCDGLDNDCDGIADNDASCGSGSCGGPGVVPCSEIPIPPSDMLPSTCKVPFPPLATEPCPIANPGAQYYVSAATGNDLNDGMSPDTAWKTLCHASAVAPEGSTVQVAEGEYTSAEVHVNKELTVKGGYDATFSAWDPDAHPTKFYGRLFLDHNGAVFGGFRILGHQIQADSWSYVHHVISAGTLVRNEIVVDITSKAAFDPPVLNVYAILASACPGGISVLRCNHIYVRSTAPGTFVTDAIEYGNVALHQGQSVLDSNHVCLDQVGSATSVVDGYGTCGVAPSYLLLKNNVLEKAGGFGGSGVSFYGCGESDMSITLTNNTILSRGNGIDGYEGPPSVLHYKLTNNIIFSMTGGDSAVSLGSGAVQIVTSEGNLTFGFSNNGIFPAPIASSGDDTSGAATPTSVFVNAAGGDFHPKPAGEAIAKGINVYGLATYGAVTTDITQKPRPFAGDWDRGAYSP